jgi:ankyrin repeat protein
LNLIGTMRCTELLLGFEECDVRKGGGQLGSALHLAGTKLDPVLFERLLKKGGQPNAIDFERNTVLHLVFSIFSRSSFSSAKICGLLLESGASANCENGHTWTPLHLAVKRGQLDALTWAINFNKKLMREHKDRRFKFNKKGGENQWTPLHLASHLGNFEMIELLSAEAEADLFRENSNSQTAMNVVYQSTLAIKYLRKYELRWVERKILKNKSPDGNTNGRNVSTMKQMIERRTNDKLQKNQVAERFSKVH